MRDQARSKELLTRQLLARGGVAGLPDYPDGPRLERFEPLELAQGLEHEVNRCGEVGWTRISLHLGVVDAQALAAYLRRTAMRIA